MVSVSFVNKIPSFDLYSFEKDSHFCSLLQEFDAEALVFLKKWFDNNEDIIVKTSGSTGTPKKISLSKEKMKQSALNTISYFKLQEGDTILQCLPSSFIAGKMIWVRAIIGKLNVLMAPIKSNPIKDLQQTVDFAAMTPLQATTVLSETPEKFDFIKKLIIGGAPVSVQLLEDLQDIKPICYATYGMTETITHIALQPLNGKYKSDHFEALDGISFSLGESQNLEIHAPFLSEKPFITEDIVSLKDATHFKWLGRKDFVINSGGVKLFPEQIEQKLSKLISSRFFIYGIKDDKFGEVPVLVIESKEEIDLSKLNQVLSKIEMPKKVFYLTHFVETQSGKVDRRVSFRLLGSV